MKFSEITKQQFDDFNNKLQKHYDEEGNLFTEDLIRYWFIKFFQEIDPTKNRNNTLIEEPYVRADKTKLKLKQNFKLKTNKQNGNRSRADLFYSDNDEVFEFKYHRKTTYSKSCTGTNLGSLLNDFNRLSVLNNIKKYSIYVFDQEMKNYYINPKHKNRFDFVNYDNIIRGNVYSFKKNLYGKNGIKEILTNAFASFYDKSHYIDKYEDEYDFRKFNYNIKVLYKAEIKDNYNTKKNQNNLYMIVYEII